MKAKLHQILHFFRSRQIFAFKSQVKSLGIRVSFESKATSHKSPALPTTWPVTFCLMRCKNVSLCDITANVWWLTAIFIRSSDTLRLKPSWFQKKLKFLPGQSKCLISFTLMLVFCWIPAKYHNPSSLLILLFWCTPVVYWNGMLLAYGKGKRNCQTPRSQCCELSSKSYQNSCFQAPLSWLARSCNRW